MEFDFKSASMWAVIRLIHLRFLHPGRFNKVANTVLSTLVSNINPLVVSVVTIFFGIEDITLEFGFPLGHRLLGHRLLVVIGSLLVVIGFAMVLMVVIVLTNVHSLVVVIGLANILLVEIGFIARVLVEIGSPIFLVVIGYIARVLKVVIGFAMVRMEFFYRC